MWLKLLTLSCFTVATFASFPTGKWRNYVGSGQLDEDVNLEKTAKVSRLVDPIDGISYRLPNNTNPLHYSVSLLTEIHDSIFKFSGRVQIKIGAMEALTSITLHHRQLKIENVNILREAGGTMQGNVTNEYDSVREFLTITPRLPISKGMIVWIDITYSGILRNEFGNDQAGFYRTSYVDSESKRHWLAVTQFEATDARHAFPCFDEPLFRSTFDISIKHHNSYNAVSNMPLQSTVEVDGTDYVIDTFQTSPEMPTYLVGFLISDFTSTATEQNFGIPHKIYAKSQSIDNDEARVARDVSGRILSEFERYFGIRYSLPKMDQAAIPEFAGGAMENWVKLK